MQCEPFATEDISVEKMDLVDYRLKCLCVCLSVFDGTYI